MFLNICTYTVFIMDTKLFLLTWGESKGYRLLNLKSSWNFSPSYSVPGAPSMSTIHLKREGNHEQMFCILQKHTHKKKKITTNIQESINSLASFNIIVLFPVHKWSFLFLNNTVTKTFSSFNWETGCLSLVSLVICTAYDKNLFCVNKLSHNIFNGATRGASFPALRIILITDVIFWCLSKVFRAVDWLEFYYFLISYILLMWPRTAGVTWLEHILTKKKKNNVTIQYVRYQTCSKRATESEPGSLQSHSITSSVMRLI